jgi:hypothetical protein
MSLDRQESLDKKKKQTEQNAGCSLKMKWRKLVLGLNNLLKNPLHPLHKRSRLKVSDLNVSSLPFPERNFKTCEHFMKVQGMCA